MFILAMEPELSYSPSPRPTFDGPAHIPAAAVTRHLWGDLESGEVADWIYVSSDKIHQLVFELLAPPPSQGTSGAYARTKPYLSTLKYTQDQWLGRWPMAHEEAARDRSM